MGGGELRVGEVRSLRSAGLPGVAGRLILQNPEPPTLLSHLNPSPPKARALARSDQSESLTSFILIRCQFINSDPAVISLKILLFYGRSPPRKSPHRARTFA